MNNNNNTIIELANVFFTNDEYIVLENINLEIYKDVNTAIIGRSGSGKSTLLKIMAGIHYPDSGYVKIKGKDPFIFQNESELKNLKKQLGFVFQDAALLSNLSIKENLSLPIKYYSPLKDQNKIDSEIANFLNKIDLIDSLNERPAQLSLGEKKLIAFTRAMLIKPEILFLDEPISSIDATTSKKMIKLIKEYADLDNTTLVIVTNQEKIISELCDRIILIENKTISLNEYKSDLMNIPNEKKPEVIYDIFNH